MDQSLYAEAGCKPKKQGKDYLFMAGLALMGVAALICILFSGNLIIGAIGLVLVVGIVFLYPKLNVEYEYIFCDGQLDFDKIFSGSRRKTALKIDMENVEIVVQADDARVNDYKTDRVVDFSSHAGSKSTYAIFVTIEDKMTKVLFEPSGRMLEAMKNKSPRKVQKAW